MVLLLQKATSQNFPIPSGNYGLDALTVDAAPLTILDVTPTSSPQSFTPTNPYIGYKSVTVGAASGLKYMWTSQIGMEDTSISISNSENIEDIKAVFVWCRTTTSLNYSGIVMWSRCALISSDSYATVMDESTIDFASTISNTLFLDRADTITSSEITIFLPNAHFSESGNIERTTLSRNTMYDILILGS